MNYVYVLSSKSRTLYIGVTNDLERRLYEHRHKVKPGFTSRYNITRLVHLEMFDDIAQAIVREKQLKGWVRRKRVRLIEETNPEWNDLSEGWGVNTTGIP